MGSIISRAEDSSSPLADIPEDLIKREILTRLPVNSVIRFRCVCKSWKHYLSGQDPDFVQSHLTRSSMNLNNGSLIVRCILMFNRNKVQLQYPRIVDLGGSVNGLVCVYTYNFITKSIDSVGIWNPATNLYKDIPIPPSSKSAPIPGINSFSFGIGFDSVANDYKVIYVAREFGTPLIAQVYSCDSNSWGTKCVTSTFVAQGDHFPWPTVVHGRPYWYTQDYACPQHFYVTLFDVQDDIFRLLPRINIYNLSTQWKWRVMVNLRDSLALIFTDSVQKSASRSVDVYVFDEKCHLWTKNYTIGPMTVPKYMRLLHCFRNGDLLFKSGKYIKLVGINPQTHAIDRFASGMYRYNRSRFSLVFSYGCGYIETLVSVKGMSRLPVKKVESDFLIIEKSL